MELRRASAGRQKKTNKKNLQSRASVERPDYPDPGPALSGGGRQDGEKKSKQTNKRDHPGPSTERGGSVGRKKRKRRNQSAQPNHTRGASNPDPKIPKHLKQPKDKDEDVNMQKTPGTTQGEKLRSQDAETTRNNPRRRTQKTGKLSSVAAA